MNSTEIVSWSGESDPRGRAVTLKSALNLGGLRLPPNWYRLNVWVTGGAVRVSAKAGFGGARAEIRMHLETRGRHRLEKIFKISETLASIDITADGGEGDATIDRIEIRPMRRAAVYAFLAGKGWHYALSNRRHFDWTSAWRHFRAALRPQACFAFQGRYGTAGHEASYTLWRTLHENAQGAERLARTLADRIGERVVRVALIVGDGIDDREARAAAKSLAAGSRGLAVVPVRAARLATQDPGARNDPSTRDPWDFALILDRAGAFAPFALERLILQLLDAPEARAVFADSDTIVADGIRGDPLLKPPLWDRELLWSSDYIKAPLLLRWTAEIRDVLKQPGATARPSYAFALMLSATVDRCLLKHYPAILFHERKSPAPISENAELAMLNTHLRAIGHPCRAESVAGTRRVAWPLPEAVRVSIIIPSKDNPDLLNACIQSIRDMTIGLDPEIIVADNGSVKPATRAYLSQLELAGTATVIPCPGPFNFSKINNDARRYATGNILVFLNDDTRVLSKDWLVELASQAARPEVGAVGALLLYPDGTVQHAGVLLGVRGIADHAFRHENGDAPGYLGLLRCRREVTAVTGACLAVSAAHFDAVGGFDESLAVTSNDIDLCLRLRARGWTNIWSPWCVLEHAESKSRGIDSTDAALERQGRETLTFTTRWGHLLDCDPTYNPGLSRVAPDFRLATE